MRRRMGWIVALVLVGGGIAYFTVPWFLGPVVPVTTVVRRDIVQTVVTSGLVQTPFRIDVGSKIIGVVAGVPVEEGQAVKAGDLLIQLDDAQARTAVATAGTAVAQAQAKLEQLRNVAAPLAEEARRQAEAALVNAEATYRRTLDLSRHGVATTATLDDDKRALDVAGSQLRAAELQVETNRPGGMDFRVAQSLVEQMKAQLEAARTVLRDSQIRASRDGTLITRNVELGDTVQPGETLMVLAPAGETQIVVQIDEQNLGLLRLGETAAIAADAYPAQVFAATVGYINPAVNAQSGSVLVKLDVPNPPAYLRQDMTVSAEIETNRKTDAVTVDLGDVHDVAGPNPWVLVAQDGVLHRRTIRPGLRGDAALEVLGGLAPGETVVRGLGTNLADGQRLRVRTGA
ncbi:efflux RND transporter periplasmic adaptor subunit [Aureimonas sp. AU4]|uniref:efflux RND transporter periplasmic adaptor subunit n=1 Tax=Aureimonas sp. AU4 TaxID=1638163 RepID=UPI00192CEF76|nr:efflux RND transporter periplasmic adaptor subunit [Aureimonas sp. AU4]